MASERGEVKGNDADEYSEFSEEAPRPPPPAPTPMIGAPDSARPRRLRQTWGGSPSVRGAISDRHGLDATYATNGEDSGDARAFVAPSKLQEASMWSTAVEQAVLERRMREASALYGLLIIFAIFSLDVCLVSHKDVVPHSRGAVCCLVFSAAPGVGTSYL